MLSNERAAAPSVPVRVAASTTSSMVPPVGLASESKVSLYSFALCTLPPSVAPVVTQ